MENLVTITYEELKNLITMSVQASIQARFDEELKDRDLQIQELESKVESEHNDGVDRWYREYNEHKETKEALEKAQRELEKLRDYIGERGLAENYREWLEFNSPFGKEVA